MGYKESEWDNSTHMRAELTQTYPARLSESTIGISRVRSNHRNNGKTDPYQPHDAYLVVSQLQPFAEQTLWVDGKLAPHAPFQTGSMAVYDLERRWVSDLHQQYDCLHFYLPRAAIESVAEEVGAKPNTRLYLPPHLNVLDETVRQIGQLLLPALARPQEVSRLFVDHLALALHAHLVHRYGDRPPPVVHSVGALAPWQARRAKDFLLAHLTQDTTLEDVARECGLTRSYFIKSFRAATGVTPHQWIIAQRVIMAKDLMRATSMSMAEVALTCGFADQSHFSRVFKKKSGSTPRAWRMQCEPNTVYSFHTRNS